MTEEAFRGRTAQQPASAGFGFKHFDLIARGEHVGKAGQKLEALSAISGVMPADYLSAQIEAGVSGDVKNIREDLIAGPATGLKFCAFAEEDKRFGKGVVYLGEVGVELKVFTLIVTGENDGATGVFFFGATQ